MMKLDNVSAKYSTISGDVLALKDLNFVIRDNEIFGIAGESGCGKSTLLKVMYDILKYPLSITEGKVYLEYTDRDGQKRMLTSGEIHKVWWKVVSYIPQAAMSVLNPVYRLQDQFYELIQNNSEIKMNKRQMKEMVVKYLNDLNLPADILTSFPHQLSGGMRQRVVIAMATFLNPNMIFADEPTTALDVVVQRSILVMLMELQKKMGNTLVVVSHDMGVHYQITHHMGIMYSGSMVEVGETEALFENPLHPYTHMLINAIPKVGEIGMKEGIPGSPPSLRNPPPGCRFAPRCPHAKEICNGRVPEFREVEPGRFAACHLLNKQKGGQ